MIAAPMVLTKPLGAVMATRPANSPLPAMEASGFPYRIHMHKMAPNDPVQPASIVFTAIDATRSAPLPEAARVLPGLNPNQPNASMKQPDNTTTMSCTGSSLASPLL